MANDQVKLTVQMKATVPQALTLQAFFKHWNYLSGIGSSRMVAFFVDGDGNFHPKCQITVEGDCPELTKEMEEKAQIHKHQFDFDPVAWSVRK